ncbi:MAG: MFS transporter [Candidatus Adiutrix sp.]|nr:MFS transporter [Candidatus Adiutrix sp.]
MTALVLAWLSFAFRFADGITVGPVMPRMLEIFDMTRAQGGSLISIGYLGGILATIPAGIMVDRFGYRKVLMGSVFCVVVGCILMTTMSSYSEGFIYRFISGVGAGGIVPSGNKAAFDWFSAKSRGKAVAFFLTGTNAGLIVANMTVPRVVANYNWNTPWFIWATVCSIILVVSFFVLRENPANSASASGRPVMTMGQILKSFAGLLKNRNVMVIAFTGAGFMWANVGTQSWTNTYMNKHLNIPLITAGYLVTTYAIVGLLSKFMSGAIIDRVSSRKAVLATLMLFYGAVLVWFGSNQIPWMLYLLVPLMGMANALPSPVLNVIAMESVAPQIRGTTIALCSLIYNIGSTLCPIAVGKVVDLTGGNYAYVFLTIAAGPLFGGTLAAIGLKSYQKP